MRNFLLPIGYDNLVAADKIVAIINYNSQPARRLRESARRMGKLVDATHGRKTRALIITVSDHVILSGINVDTILNRFHSLARELGGKESDEE